MEPNRRSQGSRPCIEIDERVRVFRARPIEGDGPCLWLDATYLKVREPGGSSPSS
jgi:putative transposase